MTERPGTLLPKCLFEELRSQLLFSFSPVSRTFSPFSCTFPRDRLLPRTFSLFSCASLPPFRNPPLLSLSPPAMSLHPFLIRALFPSGQYASSAKSSFEGQKRGRCDIVMSHEERFPSPNAESALGRNCTGGALWLDVQLVGLGWSGQGKARLGRLG